MQYPQDYVNQIINGDCLDILKELKDNCIDFVLTDPPYNLDSIKKRFSNAKTEVKDKDGLYKRISKGFMNQDWDVLPSIEIWSEVFRVMKPGAFAFIFMTPRQDSYARTIVRLEDAGFVIGFTSMYHVYQSGMPKAHNIGYNIDKKLGNKRETVDTVKLQGTAATMKGNKKKDWYDQGAGGTYTHEYNITAPTSDIGKYYDGYYTYNPKPAIEIIIVVMKPLIKNSYVDQAIEHYENNEVQKACVNFKECRIPTDANDKNYYKVNKNNSNSDSIFLSKTYKRGGGNKYGKFPANVLVSDNSLGKYSDNFDLDFWFKEKIKKLPKEVQMHFPTFNVSKPSPNEKDYNCEDLKLDKHIFADETKTGLTKSLFCKKCGRRKDYNCDCNAGFEKKDQPGFRKERKNIHPTQKSIKLLTYLLILGSNDGDLVLDPFAGSGTTGLACKMNNRNYILIEKSKKYYDIIKTRLEKENQETLF